MGMSFVVIPEKVTFTYKSSNYDGTGRWGSFRLEITDDEENKSTVYLEKDEMIVLAMELLEASGRMVE